MTAKTRTFDIPTSDSGDSLAIHIAEPDLKRQHLGLSTWGSSLILASRLHNIHIPPSDPSLPQADGGVDAAFDILELGAGTGLVGITAAALWRRNVLLTDLPEVVSNLASNIALNAGSLDAANVQARAGSLDWSRPRDLTVYGGERRRMAAGGEVEARGGLQDDDAAAASSSSPSISPSPSPSPSSRQRTASIILAADTVYSEEHPAALSRAVLTWLEPGAGARLCLAYPLRPAYLDYVREVWAALEAGGLQCLEEGKAEVDDSWDDERLHEWSVWGWRPE